MQSILVAIVTRDRPQSLQACVEAVVDQDLPGGTQVEVLVVDNASSMPLPETLAGATVVEEHAIGIPFARNRAVRVARSRERDALVFIDDDEVPGDRQWLARLLEAQHTYGADVVTGPVDRQVPPGTPRYVADHPFLARSRRRRTGSRVKVAYTNNVLVPRAVFDRPDFVFRAELSESGGSDHELFRRLGRAGTTIVWCDEASVHETMSGSRATVRWILRRSWRLGINRIQRLRLGDGARRAWILYVVGACGEIGVGVLGQLLWPLRPREALIALDRAVRGVATLAGLLGARAAEYRVGHERR